MKFKLAPETAPFKAYGYYFDEKGVDVTEDHLINKFSKYHQLFEVKRGAPKKVKIETEDDADGIKD